MCDFLIGGKIKTETRIKMKQAEINNGFQRDRNDKMIDIANEKRTNNSPQIRQQRIVKKSIRAVGFEFILAGKLDENRFMDPINEIRNVIPSGKLSDLERN